MSDHQINETAAKEAQDSPPDLLPVYPNLVFREFMAILACLLAVAWVGLLIEAPLDAPAEPEFTPNPAKAPWYFLGIQELLVYFDPWLAGVVIPLVIISGLILVPLLDNDPEASGIYSFRARIWATLPFTSGLLLLVLLTVMAAFFRGANWDWYWPWESWSMAKPARHGFISLPNWLGFPLVGLYYLMGLVLPFALLRRRLKNWSPVRRLVYFFLVLTMMAVPIKIIIRLLFNIRYIIRTPWFNI